MFCNSLVGIIGFGDGIERICGSSDGVEDGIGNMKCKLKSTENVEPDIL